MDARFFLKQRTTFIRFYFESCVKSFEEIRTCIENGLPPYDSPPYSEDGEPAYLEDWLDTNTAEQILGLTCVSLLSDSLKLYFQTLQRRVIGFEFEDKKSAFKNGFVHAYLRSVGEILETDWSDCPANIDVIEQIVLTRNRGHHGADLTSFEVTHDKRTLEKYPQPFFTSADEWEDWFRIDGALTSFLLPSIKITQSSLFSAIDQVEALVEWIDGRMGKASDWRMRQPTL